MKRLANRPTHAKAAYMARVAFLLPDLNGGGAERVALTLIRHYVDLGHDVDVVLRHAHGELLSLLPPQARVVDLQAARLRHVVRPLVRYLRERRPDTIQALMWPLTTIAVIAKLLARSRARLVVVDHTMVSREHAHLGRIARWLLSRSIRMTYPLADARVIVSPRAADDLAGLSGIARGSIQTIRNPVDPPGDDFAADGDPPWRGSGARILSVGSMKAEKNHLMLLDAFAAVCRRLDAQLLLIGDGALRPALEARARDLGVADRVSMPGFLLDPAAAYASADLFVLSSDFEGYPLVLVEAMFAGLRIVSTDCDSGPREILDGARFGRLVPVRDADALADAIAVALAAPHDPASVRARAHALSADSFAHYDAVMLGASPPR